MGLLQRMRNAVTLAARSETPPSVLPPARAAAGRIVGPNEALTLGSVYRAVDIISTAVSQLGMGVWRDDREIDTPSVVRKPDLNSHRAAFFELTATSLATTGNAFWRKHSTAPGEPVLNLEVLPAHECAVLSQPLEPLRVSWRGVELKAWQVTQLQKMRLGGRRYGLGPIEAAAGELRGALDLRDYAAEWFDNSGIPNGLITTEQKLTREQTREWKAQAIESFKATGPAVLSNGLDYKPIVLRPADAQFLESRQFSVTEIARMFGIPAAYLLAAVEGTSDTYSNQEQVDIWFVRYTLMSYLREIETAMSALLPRGQEARFRVDALLRTDTKTRYEAHKVAVDMGLYTVQHAQRIEGLPITAAATPAPTKESTDA